VTERAPREGLLSIVATPIGNLEDVTLRALRTLREADAILAEDTRRTAVLCRHHGVVTPLRSFHAHTPEVRIAEIADELRAGARLAIVSDAGTPLVSDPGAELVRAAIERGVRVEAIPGASAPIAALAASGLAGASFSFVGFLPRSGGRRMAALAELAKLGTAIVLFEAPSRVGPTLHDLAETLGETRRAALCRELTKLHEEIARGTLSELADRFAEGTLGEVTIVIERTGPAPEEREPVDDAAIRAWIADEGLGTKDAAARLAQLEGISKKDAYKRVLLLGRNEAAKKDDVRD
jgi:16S rRNA (cytidine1402-2'-O)-methyltransferase